MEILFIVGFIGLVFIFSLVGRLTGGTRTTSPDRSYNNLPRTVLNETEFVELQEKLGLKFVSGTKHYMRPQAERLEKSFPLSYQVNVFNRMVKETSFEEKEIMELLLEQKRFLLMASVLKNVPMFSEKVDEVWHQMLMFTQDYQAFTEAFAGQFIHHQPNVDGVDGEDDKFIFAMMYHEMFHEMPSTENAWGFKFFDKRPSDSLIREWDKEPINALEGEYFFGTAHARSVSRDIIQNIKSAIQDSRRRYTNDAEFTFKRKAIIRNGGGYSANSDATLTLPYVLWVATSTPSNYSEYCGHTKSNSSGDTGGSGGFFGGGGHNGHDDHSGGHSGHDSGGSSCGSSCGGGGCGSS